MFMGSVHSLEGHVFRFTLLFTSLCVTFWK